MEVRIPATLGRRIADCRQRRGWTQKRLADEAGISVTFLSDVENDKCTMGSDILLRVADALGASIDYLLKGEVERIEPRQPLVIPPELAEAAEEQGWSVGETRDLLRARQIVVARRSRETGADNRERRLSKQEWIGLYQQLFGDERTR